MRLGQSLLTQVPSRRTCSGLTQRRRRHVALPLVPHALHDFLGVMCDVSHDVTVALFGAGVVPKAFQGTHGVIL